MSWASSFLLDVPGGKEARECNEDIDDQSYGLALWRPALTGPAILGKTPDSETWSGNVTIVAEPFVSSGKDNDQARLPCKSLSASKYFVDERLGDSWLKEKV